MMINRRNSYNANDINNLAYHKRHPIISWTVTIIILIIAASVVGLLLGLLKGSDAPDANQPTNQALNRIQKSVGKPQNQPNPEAATPRSRANDNESTSNTNENISSQIHQLKREMKNIKIQKNKRNKLIQIYNQLDKSTQNKIYNYAQHYYHIIPSKSLKLKLLSKFLNEYKD